MSGVFSITSHWALQYLPDVVVHEQKGCAPLSPLAVAISTLRIFESAAGISSPPAMQRDYACLSDTAHIAMRWPFAEDSSIEDSFQISATVIVQAGA
jgi:hypothetical protein